nr:DUF882 domain-containing protein [Roseospira visakhapatnamensis]
MATAPVVPGVKPDQPFRLGPGLRPGLKPDQPVRPDGVLDVAQASGPPRPVVVHRPGSAASSSTRLVVHRVPATVRPGDVRDRALYLDNVNTGETLKVAYLDNGRYLPKALKAINWLMRDRRTDEVVSIDVGLLDLLSDLAKTLDTRQPIRIVSGYRSPQTNRAMRARNRSVARKSYHTRGMAADIAVPGVDVPSLFRVAVAMGRGGVGDYPGSGFVHVDVGPRRTW